MGVNATGNVTTQTDVYASYSAATTKADSSSKADTTEQEEAATGVVYEKSDSTTDTSKTTYSINKMSAEDRAALVSQLKADQESRQSQLTSLVQKMLTQQATTYSNANSIWSIFANGDLSTVDDAAKQQAQQDISEDGYYGVKQTSERLFDFACALAGDDVDKMKEMQEAMAKGFSQATSAWGKDLPDICQQTLDAANKKFEEYYKSKASDTSTDTE